MEIETFYGVTLNEKEPLAQFEVEDSEHLIPQKLIIKHIILSADAKENEFNVIQAETRTNEKEILKIPIAVLKAGETRALRPNIEFPSSSVTFKLIQGTGPVHIYGQHILKETYSEFYQGDEDETDEDDVDEHIPIQQTNGKNSNKKK